MPNLRRLEARMRKLESSLKSRGHPPCSGIGCVMHGASMERQKNLAPGERVVTDWFRDSIGFVHGQYRITSNPNDQGRRCKAGGYLLDVLEEIHQNCSEREKSGSCQVCHGTPVAEEEPDHPPASQEDF